MRNLTVGNYLNTHYFQKPITVSKFDSSFNKIQSVASKHELVSKENTTFLKRSAKKISQHLTVLKNATDNIYQKLSAFFEKKEQAIDLSSEQAKPIIEHTPSLSTRHKQLHLTKEISIIYHPQTKKYIYLRPAPVITNLVISGGGAKGIVIPGVIQAFEEKKVSENLSFRDQLSHVCGSSAGAIYSSLLAVGCSASQIHKITSTNNLKKLLGEKISSFSLTKTGTPLLKLMQSELYEGLKTNLCKIFEVESLDALEEPQIEKIIRNLLKESPVTIEDHIDEIKKITNKIKNGEKTITFKMLRELHTLEPKIFKLLTVTGTCIETGQTLYFNSENTPNLDIALACRASASLPIILEHVRIDRDSLCGGKYEEFTKDYSHLHFIDGGYFDNIPVGITEQDNHPRYLGENGQNLQTLALVFDETPMGKNKDNIFRQSPFFETTHKAKKPLYRPNFMTRLTRNRLVKFKMKINSNLNNTEEKAKGLERVANHYTQRNIPLKIALKTTDFDKINNSTVNYQQIGVSSAHEYLENHDKELISQEFENLSELLSLLPKSLQIAKQKEIDAFFHQMSHQI